MNKTSLSKKKCGVCVKMFTPVRKRQKFCSPACAGKGYSLYHNDIKTINRRFLSNIKKTGGCWEWQLGKDKDGYGIFTIAGKSKRAHRVSYKMHVGRIPKGMFVLHKCDNACCVNPKHLFIGKHKDNMADMVRKGRSPLGEKNSHSKLTESDVIQIREMYGDNVTQDAIAKIYDITQGLVGFIVRGESWKHLLLENRRFS